MLTATKTLLALLQCVLWLFRLIPFVKCCQIFLLLNSKRLCQSSWKVKESHCLVFTSCNMYKNVWHTCRVVVLPSSTYCFLFQFSLPSLSPLLKQKTSNLSAGYNRVDCQVYELQCRTLLVSLSIFRKGFCTKKCLCYTSEQVSSSKLWGIHLAWVLNRPSQF